MPLSEPLSKNAIKQDKLKILKQKKVLYGEKPTALSILSLKVNENFKRGMNLADTSSIMEDAQNETDSFHSHNQNTNQQQLDLMSTKS